MAKNVLSLSQKFAVAEYLKGVTSSPAKGFIEYHDGHNDTTVAAACKCTAYNVLSVRESLFGKLLQPRTPAPAAMAEVDKRLASIEKWLDAYDATWRDRLL